MSLSELPEIAEEEQQEILSSLKKKGKAGPQVVVVRIPAGVAADYQQLVYEMIKRLAQFEQESPRAVVVGGVSDGSFRAGAAGPGVEAGSGR